MNEIVAVLMFLGLAFGLGLAGLLVTGAKWLYDSYRSRRSLNNMPMRIRRLNGKMFG